MTCDSHCSLPLNGVSKKGPKWTKLTKIRTKLKKTILRLNWQNWTKIGDQMCNLTKNQFHKVIKFEKRENILAICDERQW